MNTEDMDIKINQLANDFEDRQIQIFRWLHQHPELAMQEFKSSRYILDYLKTLSVLEIIHPISKTGIKAVLRGGKPGPTVALRADFDALPVKENTSLPYASKVKTTYNGQETFVSHACGHDANTAVALGAATILSQLKDEIPGNVVFIFQPAEEGVPTHQERISTDQRISTHQEGGAALMVKEGVLKNPDVQAIFALHTNSKYYPGKVILRSGVTHASMDTIIIKIYGSQAHGSQPWKGKDPILAGSAVINSLQTIISREVDLQRGAAVITVGYFHGGIKVNIIPDKSEMGLTVRSLNESNHKLLMKRIKEVADLEAMVHGCRAQVLYGQHYPLNENNPELYQTMLSTVKRVAGPENMVHYLAKTTSEDFSYFSREVPGLYIHFGTAPLNRPLSESKPNHHPQFQVDETSLKFATRLECSLLFDSLNTL
jgi:amidohydrolase